MSSGTITAANVATSIPLTAGSSIPAISAGPGTGSLTFQITGAGSYTIGVLATMDGLNFAVLPAASITNSATGATGAPTAPGIYTVPVPAGSIYIYASAYASGTPTVTALTGLGTAQTPGASGGGETVTVPGGIPGYPSAPTETSVSCTAGALTTILAAGTYKNIVLQNNSGTVGTAGNVWVSFSGATITGGTYQNYYCLYANGGGWSENPNGVTTSAITVWNPSGSAVVVYVRTN